MLRSEEDRVRRIVREEVEDIVVRVVRGALADFAEKIEHTARGAVGYYSDHIESVALGAVESTARYVAMEYTDKTTETEEENDGG